MDGFPSFSVIWWCVPLFHHNFHQFPICSPYFSYMFHGEGPRFSPWPSGPYGASYSFHQLGDAIGTWTSKLAIFRTIFCETTWWDWIGYNIGCNYWDFNSYPSVSSNTAGCLEIPKLNGHLHWGKHRITVNGGFSIAMFDSHRVITKSCKSGSGWETLIVAWLDFIRNADTTIVPKCWS